MKSLFASPQFASLLSAWNARSRRERQLLLAAAVVIVVAVLWSAHDSMRKERQRLDRVIPTAAAQLKSMQEQAAELARLTNQPRLPKMDATRQTEEIQAAAKANDLTVQIRPESGRLTISGDAPHFNVVANFLGQLQKALGMRSEALDVSRIATGVHFELRLAPLN